MSEHFWTEKEIKNFIRRRRDEKGWLNTRDIRLFNKVKASDLRQLMKIVVDLKVAFDNEIEFNSDRYRICFDL